VVGRHERTDVALQSDPSLSLRHVLVILQLDANGNPFVRVLDLRSGTGMKDEQGTSHYSVAANGPVALEIADSVLFVLPANVDLEATSDRAAAFKTLEWPVPVPWIPDRAPEARLREISEVTHCSSVVSVVQGRTGMGRPIIRRHGEKRVGMIRLEYDDTRHDHDVDATALRTGVLVGRYGRCDLSELSIKMPDVISRVHALFISMEERVHVFDVGSTNGLTYQSFPIRTLALPEHHPSIFDITEGVRLTWWPS
jgi:hypothetical protein